MNPLTMVLFGLAALVVYLNALASISLYQCTGLSRFQKAAQGLMVWLVPVIGAKVVIHLLAEAEPEALKWIPQRGHGWLVYAGYGRSATHRHETTPHESITHGESSGAGGGGD